MTTSTPAEKSLLVSATGRTCGTPGGGTGAVDHTRGDPGSFRDRILHRYGTTGFPTVTGVPRTDRGLSRPGSIHIR
jgi:hypothetical protein